MKSLFLAVLAAFVLAGCGTVINPSVSAALNNAGQDYMGAKANIQQADDMKLRLWLDSACAVNIGALQRAISTSGNPSIANAIFTACPVPAVGVTSTSATGSMQVQTFNLPPIVRDSGGSVSNAVPLALPPADPVNTPAVTSTPAPVTSGTSALQTYVPPKRTARPHPAPVAPTPVPLTPAPTPSPAPAQPATPAPAAAAPVTQPSVLPGGLPGGLPGQ